MPINADKPLLWKKDIQTSVDLFNNWFLKFAPKAYRDTRIETTKKVEEALHLTNDLGDITPAVLLLHPRLLQVFRMATCPPLARDRLIGLAGVSKNLVKVMEAEEGCLAVKMPQATLDEQSKDIIHTITQMLDVDIFPWMASGKPATDVDRHRASTIVADRLCGSISDPIIRNAQEKRQLAYIGKYLKRKGYTQKSHPASGKWPKRPGARKRSGALTVPSLARAC